MPRFAFAAALLAGALLTACAQEFPYTREGETVTEDYRIASGRLSFGTGVWIAARLRDQAGEAEVCAAVGYDTQGSSLFLEELVQGLFNGSRLLFDDQRVGPRFSYVPVRRGDGAPEGAPSYCAATGVPWQEGMQDRRRLSFDIPQRVEYGS